MTPQRILVLDGHTNPALACVRSLGRAGHTVFVASRFRRPLGSWSRWCSGAVRLSSFTLAGFAELRHWAEREAIGVLLPVSEESALLVNAERAAWEAIGVRVGATPGDLAVQAFDKGRTLRTAEALGLHTPQTAFPQSSAEVEAAGRAIGFPCIVKSRMSHPWNGRTFLSSLGPAVATDPASLAQAVEERRQGDVWPLVQAYASGRRRSAFALYHRGQPIAWFAMESLRVVRPLASPASLRRSAPIDWRLRGPAEQLLTAFRWHGPAMVEFLDDGVRPPCLLEVNGRFWNSLELAVAAGADFPAWWVHLLCDQPLPPSVPYRLGVTVRWLWGDVKRVLGTLVDPVPPGCPERVPTTREALRDLLGVQPDGTRSEMWRTDDPAPGLGEWLEAVRDVRHEIQRRVRHARMRGREARTAGLRLQKAAIS